ncbi:MAG TPA: HAMP domain-containing sensor histidine kinase [Dermatophilaceae bacterium]|nr:HAMP domain-containing sensor histidine kinase [Dermatophilaceae bacterium]
MRTRISLLVAATSSAIILAFVIPMGLLVRTLAEDRAVAAAQQQAQGVAVIVSSLDGLAGLAEAVDQTQRTPTTHTSVVLPSGAVVGYQDAGLAQDPLVRRARDHRSAFTQVTSGGIEVLVPVALDVGTAVVRTRVLSSGMHRGVGMAWGAIGVLGLALFLVALLVARQLAGRIGTPVSDLAAVAHRLRSGDFDARVEPAGPVEVAEVGVAFNQLADRIGELVAAEREFVADLSHRLRTPVTALRLDAEAVAEPEVAGRLRAHVDQLQRSVDAIVREARRPVRGPLHGSCDAARIAAERVGFWRPLAEDQGRRMSLRVPSTPVPVGLAADDLRDLVDNLVDNVFAHTPEGVAIDVAVSSSADGTATLTVADSGPGLPEHALVGRRGATGSGSTGLGLDIVRRIARDSGGEATLGASPGGGAMVTVVLGPPR